MKQQTKTIIKSLAFFLVFALAVISVNVYGAFTPPPPGNPGDGNVETPINTSEAIQIKKGGWIVAFERVLGILLVGGKAEFADTIKIYGGNPGVNKVLVSDAVGLASWVDPSTLPGWGGTPAAPLPPAPPPQGVVPVSLGGTGLTTIANNSIWVANSLDSISVLTPGANQSIRINGANASWEAFTPLTSNGSGGTVNTVAKFTGPHTLGDSQISDDGTTIITGGNFKVGGNLIFSTIVPSSISGTINNYDLPNSVVHVKLLTTTNAPVTIHGFASGGNHIHGRVVVITNGDTSGTIIIKNDSASAALANRVHLANDADLTLTHGESVILMYEAGFGGGSRWMELNHL